MKLTIRTIQIIITLILLIIACAVWIYRDKTKQDILQHYDITKGQIVDYYIISVDITHYLEYKYNVDDIEYLRKINPVTHFDQCENNLNLCEDKLFWVIYDPDAPEKSLIDLTVEIQDIENPPFPETLDNFE